MSICVPNVGKIKALELYLADPLTLKLYSNNVTPNSLKVAGDFTEVVGGGYANFVLTFAHWGITGGSPGRALYDEIKQFTFTGPTTAPGTIYGYFVVDAGGVLRWAERFPVTPFTPINGSFIRAIPRFSAGSIFAD
jgi:hypothetical protein